MRGAAAMIASAALLCSTSTAAKPTHGDPALRARPILTALVLPAGESRLGHRAFVYRPTALPRGPHPLLVILHGHGQAPQPFLRMFEKWADRCGAIVLAPVAEATTWDIIAQALEFDGRATRPARPTLRFANDARRIDEGLKELFGAAPIDPNRVALLGFSDGATYALSLGLANPHLFPWIIALSPGFVLWPEQVARKQKVFIAHGTRDSRLDFTNTRDGIVKPLRAAGMDVEFRPFDGDHVMVASIMQEALGLAFGADCGPGT